MAMSGRLVVAWARVGAAGNLWRELRDARPVDVVIPATCMSRLPANPMPCCMEF